jgi:putative tricarboxylic transport membrane protein
MARDEINVTQGAPDAVPVSKPDRALVGSKATEAVVMMLLLGFSIVLGMDNIRTGIGWQPDGPEAGYFPFYLAIMLGVASIYGLFDVALRDRDRGEAFVTRAQFARVLQVLVPTILFVLATQFLGIYIASFILIAGFMSFIGRIALWKSILTATIFAAIIFFVFEMSFNVIMPKGPIERALGF